MKGNKKLFAIFITEIVIVILMALGIVGYYNKHFNDQYATQDEFRNLVNSKNYTVEDLIRSDVKVYDLASTKDKELSLHYIVANSGKKANKVFKSLNYQINSRKQSGLMNVISVDFFNYNYYSLENGGNYFVVAKNDNTIFAAAALSQYKDEINTLVKDLGFSYPSNTIYVILSIVVVIYILMIVVMWKIFEKAGVKGWKFLIPIYNCYCLSKISFNKGWYFIFMLITPINILFIPATIYQLSKKFGKSTLFAVLSIFFPYITTQIIAFDDSKYID